MHSCAAKSTLTFLLSFSYQALNFLQMMPDKIAHLFPGSQSRTQGFHLELAPDSDTINSVMITGCFEGKQTNKQTK